MYSLALLDIANFISRFRFGFVEFSSAEQAASAFDRMKGQEVDGRQVFLDFAAERSGGGGGEGFGGRKCYELSNCNSILILEHDMSN